ncbi:unnamed protein product, partial [Gongylonema pulchrum]|uniref:Ig-like domain-containing protein n=1 Tax=Gongylonema pulchrum TaxID=637853 RepID=A0A183D474_9BILA
IFQDFACGPVITAPLQESLQINEGEAASLLCVVWGDPAPTVQWHRDGSAQLLYSDGNRILLEAVVSSNGTSYHLLHIRQTISDDQTTYWCKVTTGFVTRAKRFDLRIRPVRLSTNTNNNGPILPNPSESNTGIPDYPADSNLWTIQKSQRFWQLMLLIILLFAVLLFFVACYVFCVYWFRIHGHYRRGDHSKTSDEEEPLYRCIASKPRTRTTAVATISVSGEYSEEMLQAHNLKNRLLRNEEPHKGTAFSRSCGGLARKAPLAQCDRDTSVLPIVQTSL